jgi:hypothetical protein
MNVYQISLTLELAKRAGKFNIVLCVLRAIGSSIDVSGIDDAWVEASIYGPTTTRQIIDRRHMGEYQSCEEPLPAALIKNTVLLRSACSEYDTGRTKRISMTILSKLASDLEQRLDQFSTKREVASPTFKVMNMYIEFVLTFLQFKKASCQRVRFFISLPWRNYAHAL